MGTTWGRALPPVTPNEQVLDVRQLIVNALGTLPDPAFLFERTFARKYPYVRFRTASKTFVVYRQAADAWHVQSVGIPSNAGDDGWRNVGPFPKSTVERFVFDLDADVHDVVVRNGMTPRKAQTLFRCSPSPCLPWCTSLQF